MVLLNEKFKSSLDVNLIHTLKHSNITCCVDISLDDRLIAIGGDKLARVYDTGTGKEKFRFKIDPHGIDGKNYVRAVRFGNNGRYLAAGLQDSRLILWQLQSSGRRLKVFEGHEREIYGLAIAPDGYTAITCSGDKTAQVWDLREETRSKPRAIFRATDELLDVAISPDSRFVATGCLDNSVYLWSIQTGHLHQKFSAHEDGVHSVRFSPDGQTLISASLDRSIMTWEIDPADPRKYHSPQPLKQMKLHQDFALCSLMTANGRWILSSAKDHSVIFWDAETGDPHLVLLAHRRSVIELAVGHSSRIFATVSGDMTARIWSYSA
ncbi:hypothetical protein ANO14919_006810 [Xylariales sp. No.14919]|nr:hypothetical protein ANO14919_006810 [Xylariales sp. No.14919]